jgi:uncharacterized membrane protein YphA (DoxX/SURF4 family)
MWLSAWLAQFLQQRVFAPETLRMLCQHNIASAEAFQSFLGREAIGARHWFDARQAKGLADAAISIWINLILRISLASVWIISGIVSLGLYPREASYDLLASTGVSATFAPLVLVSASVLDIVFGILTLLRPSRTLWLGQIALVCIYSLIIMCTLPEFLAQPFGPITKNIPIIAVLILLSVQGKRSTR